MKHSSVTALGFETSFVVTEAIHIGSSTQHAGSLQSDQCVFEMFIALFSHSCALAGFKGKK